MKDEAMNGKIGKFLLGLACVLCACSSDKVYTGFQPIDENGWTKNDTAVFDFTIADTTCTYDIYLYVRHTDAYSYQNMWLFINDNDTMEFYLADRRGRWLGNHAGRLYEMPVIFFEDYSFEKAGNYSFRIVHGMRDTALEGVHDIGLTIQKHGEE